jgi:protoporphyrinogen oxidase
MRKSILVVGGGVAGLACAARLLEIEPTCEVTVVEAEARVGGLASLWRCREFSADLGPHRVYTELPEIAALLPKLVATEDEIQVERRSQLYLDGHYYAYPVRAGEILRVMGPLRLGYYGASAALGQMKALMGKPRSYADAMQRAFGRALYKKIIEPYTRKVWKTPPEQLSEEVARVRVSAGNTNKIVKRLLHRRDTPSRPTALDRFTYIRGGVEGLVHALESKVLSRGGTIETGLCATAFELDQGGVKSVCAEATSEEASDALFEASAVVSTMPITDLVATLGARLGEGAEAARQLEYVGMILVGVALAKPQMSLNTWIYFPEEHLVFNRAYEPRNFDPSMAPSDRTFVVFEITARLDSLLWQTPDADLRDLVVHDAIRAGLFSKEDVLETFSRRLSYAYPIYTLDFRRYLERVCQALSQVPNLLTTGRQGLFNHNNMDHSMLMGIRAAECVVENYPIAAKAWYDHLEQFAHFRIVD